jgi:sugar (glycoside-pentoside-hexuronide) transporter
MIDKINAISVNGRFLWKQRIGFGISDFACNLSYLMVNTYLLIFYTDVVKLAPETVAFMFLVTKIFDAVTDYGVGTMIDRTYTKFGRNRPWMLAGAPVLAVGMVLLFTVPDVGDTGKLIWAYATYMLYSFGYTLVNIPMASILPTLSDESQERTNIATARSLFASFGSLTSASLTLFFVYKLGGGDQAVGYYQTSVLFAIVVFAIVVLSVLSIKEVHLTKRSASGFNIKKDFKILCNSAPFWQMAAVTYLLFVGFLASFAAIVYYFKYIVGDEMQTSVAISLFTMCPIPAMLIASWLSKKFTNKDLNQFGAFLMLAGYLILGLSGGGATMVLSGVGVVAFGLGFRQATYYSILADVVDYGEWKNGLNMAGTQAAVYGFINKVASASASAIVAYLLAWGSYNPDLVAQSDFTNSLITFSYIGLPAACTLIGIVVLYFYKVDKIHASIKKDLEQRRIKLEAEVTANGRIQPDELVLKTQ